MYIAMNRFRIALGREDDFEQLWLLAISGSLILVLDIWILIEGARLILRARPEAARS